MFERFSDQARQTVQQAQQEARRLGHDYIGTEHLLLGLLQQGDGTARSTLQLLAISPESLRHGLLARAGIESGARGKQIGFTRAARKVLEYSLREALELSHRYVGAEHMLLAMMRERDGVAGQVLRDLGGDLNAARGYVAGLVEESGPPPEIRFDPAERRPGRRAGVRGRRRTPPE